MLSMNDPSALAGMLPFDSIGLYEQPKPRFIFKMPRVVPDQKAKFESDELFRRLSRESEVRYTGFRDRPQEERQVRFQNGCREGHTEIAFIATGTNIQLVFSPSTNGYHISSAARECDFDKEHGKLRMSGLQNAANHHGGSPATRCPQRGVPLQGRKKNDLSHGHHN
ncbi:protein big brother isoform X1 [Nilaparvata lugens]|uniref:protein big brother isoform X1 n=1 Tax=Nilaparvata lugens TaxID=108931 RepID=UPI00193E9C12|nr:protein big brother isoform X1 [Nilaparvata lugens]